MCENSVGRTPVKHIIINLYLQWRAIYWQHITSQASQCQKCTYCLTYWERRFVPVQKPKTWCNKNLWLIVIYVITNNFQQSYKKYIIQIHITNGKIIIITLVSRLRGNVTHLQKAVSMTCYKVHEKHSFH